MSQNLSASASRKLAHTRRIVCNGYLRDDGLYDIEAHMTDAKGHDSTLLFKDVPRGAPIHDMRFTITIDASLVIRAARAHTDSAPTPWCSQINAAYAKLAGIAIGNGFMKEVKARLGGTLGCTHLTELLGPMATTAFQTIMGLQEGAHTSLAAVARGEGKPLLPMLDACHAWRAEGEVVQALRERAGEPAARARVRADV
ncbi:DUF2889 domain-containing protein [Paraburkholderia acidiphila]|uniref:DUF2889 domain-containing protein n=1 Tax=Paraburkholderia acidiphila TaxID=2571747 RepID=A0A7Z2G514_9BURK|nr:DUF2889 domain-containing protein [Paraburkholderia acidiphila]QGZ55142.1 DUF2889 domain-containing protein [Paraburkholderia acidiphila]